MASQFFKRMREEARTRRSEPVALHDNGLHDNGIHDNALLDDERLDNPWDEVPIPQLRHLAADGPSSDDRSASYADWAQRMKDKRTNAQNKIANATEGVAWASLGEPSVGTTNYWTTDALYAESRRVDEEELTERPNPWRVGELLATLDLREDASSTDVAVAYKKLAKAHHPDRYVSADEATQIFHAERMMTINKAYRALRQLERA